MGSCQNNSLHGTVLNMNVLIGCERSGVIREAFRARGHDAVSCDLLPAEDGSRHHLQMNIAQVLTDSDIDAWDLFIVHPDCTRLANSGSLRLYIDGKKKNGPFLQNWTAMRKAAKFFKEMLRADIPKICVENPVMHGWAQKIVGCGPTQTIQPWQFGVDASKRTCLWLKGLPPLRPTKILIKKRYANQTPSGQNKLGPSEHRAMDRARTYEPIAEAMAEQWGKS